MARASVGKMGFLLMPLFLVAVSFPLRKYFDRPIDLDKKTTGKELAAVIEADGPVSIKQKDRSQFEKVAAEELLHNKDQLRVERGGRAKVKLSTGTEIEIAENSDVVFELWREETDDSPLYMHFLTGDYRVIHQDHLRPIYVSMNNNLFLLQNKSKEAPRKLNVRQTPSALGRKNVEQPTSSVENEEEAKVALEQNADGPPTNMYIDQTIAAQKSLFQKCQTNSIRNKKQSKGQVTAGLTISPAGLVSEAKLLSTDFKDLELPNCAIDVIRRIRFKAYKGDEVIRSYPLQFE